MRTIRLRRPSRAHLRALLEQVGEADFSYPEVGASDAELPAGYDHDENRIRIGNGPEDFASACRAIRGWTMYPRPWTVVETEGIAPGAPVAMCAQAFGVWWVNPLRIVYVIDEAEPVRRFGFAYGTLPGHVERGEERFQVELQPDGTVWYDLRAFSRPARWMTRLAYPLARRLQKRFAAQSLAAMKAALTRSEPER